MVNREEIFREIWNAQDDAYDLMVEYDTLPHSYGENVLYQAEAYILWEIGAKPGITSGIIAERLKKTPSACSQIIKKLIAKGLVRQERNTTNLRMYNLFLTEAGEAVHRDHMEFNMTCQQRTLEQLSGFSDEELEIALRVQKKINECYRDDVESSRQIY